MSTIKEVVFWLNQYKHIQRDIKDIELRITQLRLKYGTPSAISYSDMPKAHNGNRDLSEYAERLEELERELIDRHTAALGLSVQYLQALDHLDREEAYIIRRRYMDGAYMVTIADISIHPSLAGRDCKKCQFSLHFLYKCNSNVA